ncbi:sulfite exporter TauE/SafE family protein [Marinomonas pollencensis]|uniref:Probable membrane transporter protein n=1 Tax=Marinomonas pollencensis TaxID=491954 RepID=A0A3E0DTC9_9GAMM|nr:sulfite exporter TauE/SafE family protein [Marinomonas pollencensis]REG85756.1 hypothetical protein DFP81_102295 [Marinomonas pollencensis]
MISSAADMITLGLFSFCGGLIDAAVGGGGLILLPALIHALPEYALSTVFGTNKVAVWAGAVTSIGSYLKRVNLVWKILLPAALSAIVFAYLGAMSVAYIAKDKMQVFVFILLVLMAMYTFHKKELGLTQRNVEVNAKNIVKGVVFGGLIGFYDGLFGPGSGSFLIFLFIRGFGFDFLNASVSAKLVNLGAFTAALLFFIPSGYVLWKVSALIAVCNILGALTGAYLALRLGSQFIRVLFLTLLLFLISRMGFTMLIA